MSQTTSTNRLLFLDGIGELLSSLFSFRAFPDGLIHSFEFTYQKFVLVTGSAGLKQQPSKMGQTKRWKGTEVRDFSALLQEIIDRKPKYLESCLQHKQDLCLRIGPSRNEIPNSQNYLRLEFSKPTSQGVFQLILLIYLGSSQTYCFSPTLTGQETRLITSESINDKAEVAKVLSDICSSQPPPPPPVEEEEEEEEEKKEEEAKEPEETKEEAGKEAETEKKEEEPKSDEEQKRSEEEAKEEQPAPTSSNQSTSLEGEVPPLVSPALPLGPRTEPKFTADRPEDEKRADIQEFLQVQRDELLKHQEADWRALSDPFSALDQDLIKRNFISLAESLGNNDDIVLLTVPTSEFALQNSDGNFSESGEEIMRKLGYP